MSYRSEEIEPLVRQVVNRLLGNTPIRTTTNGQTILSAEFVQALPIGSKYQVAANNIITPLARQVALERQIEFTTAGNQLPEKSQPTFTPKIVNQTRAQIIALGADHGGFSLKEELRKMLDSDDFGYTLVDCGTHSTQSVDYPDYAYAVARLVSAEKAWRGIIIDGAGIGSCMVANKVPGVRAAMCYDQATAVNSREHNNANVLTLGAGLIGSNLAKQIVITWLTTDFGGGRHARRVNKIDQVDRRFQR